MQDGGVVASRPQRGPSGWSLRQVWIAAGVSQGVARSLVARGLLPAEGLGAADVLVLRVASAVTAFAPYDEPLHANRPKKARAFELEAVAAARRAGFKMPARGRVLVVTASGAREMRAASATLESLIMSTPSLVLPLSSWAHELLPSAEDETTRASAWRPLVESSARALAQRGLRVLGFAQGLRARR